MDKERLEGIKEEYQWAVENSLANRINDSDIEWIISELERLQTIEQAYESLKKSL